MAKSIYIGTDSRGVVPKGSSWVDHFRRKYGEPGFISLEQNIWFTTIYDHIEGLRKINKKFDIGILQLGLNDNVIPWNLKLIEASYKKIDPEWYRYVKRAPDFSNGFGKFKNCYWYFNEVGVRKIFGEMRGFCKKLIYIEIPYTWGEMHARSNYCNKFYGGECDLIIKMPQDPGFPARATKNLPNDKVHYLESYTEILCDMVIEGVNSLII